MKINKILEKYKLIKTFETELTISKEEFIEKIKQMTEKGCYYLFLIMLDNFQSSNKKYIGVVKSTSFIIREKFIVNYFATNNLAIVSSKFYANNDKLIVKTTIKGMESFPFILRIIIFGIYLLTMFLLVIEMLLPPIQTDIDIAYILPPIFVTIFVYFLVYRPYKTATRNVIEKKDEISLIYQTIETTFYSNKK